MDIIGLGEAGCNIAECFRKYPQYNIYKIDVGVEGDKCFNVPKQKSPEDYESSAPNLSSFFSELGEEIIIVVGGSGSISGMTLRVLQELKDKKIMVVYIRPNVKSLSGNKKLLERTTFGILQEYARSGLVEEFCIVSNDAVAQIIGNLPVIGYFQKLNEVISTTIHFINLFERSEYIYGSVDERIEVSRICTVGLLNPETSEEKMFYDLELAREKSYFYAFHKDKLLKESNLIGAIEDQIDEKKEEWLTRISYRIYSTEYEGDYGYTTHRTSKVQELQ